MISRTLYAWIFAWLCFGSSYVHAQYKMHFFCPDFPPYTTVDSSGSHAGIGLDKVKSILDSVGVDYTIEINSNHGRALAELKTGRSDGFFMASQNEERDKYAVFSESVMTNRWVWIVLTTHQGEFSSQPKSGYTVASLLNTNTNRWLTKTGFNLAHPAESITSLIGMLDKQEVNAVLVAEEVYNHRFKNNPRYKVILQEEKEFGVYISKSFLNRHPQFMEKLNKAIQASQTKR
ncbi:substrate-binding periplasmic protein [Vibrio tubiashii]|uniref:substrate-binding periplasmic protein n=1 Tax=Vibrio tubiashii TaxID=29498 RepID=UPI00349EC4CA